MRREHRATSILLCAAAMLCGADFSVPASAQESQLPKAAASHSIRFAQPIDAAKTLEERLEARATFQAKEATLKNFAEVLETALDVSVVLATKKLEESAIDLDTPMTYKLRNVRVRTALEFVLGEIELSYLVKDDVLVITTREAIRVQLVTRVYDTRHLMQLPSPIKKVASSQPFMGNATGVMPPPTRTAMSDAGPDGGYNIVDLIDVVTTVVDPETWEQVGGPGSIAEFKGFVTVNHTPTVHEKLEGFLNMLHKAGGLEEKVKVSR